MTLRLYPLLVVAGLSFVFFTGKVDVPWPQHISILQGSSGEPAANFQDLTTLAAVTNNSDSVMASQSIFALLNTAQRIGGTRGARLIREQLPPLAARIEADAPHYRERLAAVNVRTSYGRRCRSELLRVNEQKRYFQYNFAAQVGRSRSTWPVVRRFRARWDRWVTAQGRICNFSF
jgi:hypothetical protein